MAGWLDLGVEHSLSRYVTIGWQVGAGSLARAVHQGSWFLPMWLPPHTTWASLQHGGCVVRVNIPREQGRNACIFMT